MFLKFSLHVEFVSFFFSKKPQSEKKEEKLYFIDSLQ